MSTSFTVPFGRDQVTFEAPPGVTATEIVSNPAPPLEHPASVARAAVLDPLGTPALQNLAAGARSVVIAVTDATRDCPDHIIVPPMLEQVAAAGVPDAAVTILVAVGTHRASTDAEKRAKLGDAIVDRYRIVDHDSADDANLVPVLDGPEGRVFRVNRLVAEADLVLATGRVEPHQYAGYSGGGKTVAIGCADESIIGWTHGPAFLDHPGTRLARLDGNPFQEAVRRVAAAAGVRFVGNVVLDDEGQMVAIRYGDPVAVHDDLARFAATLCTVPIPAQVDIAVAGVGYPKDQNVYQASRAASYLHFAPTPVVRPGGVLVVPAACPEGAGEGAGERRFRDAMIASGTPAALVEQVRRDGIRPGEQRAFVMSMVLQDVRVIFAGVHDPAEVEAMGFQSAPSIDEALKMAVGIVGTPATMVVVPHALLTLPVVAGEG